MTISEIDNMSHEVMNDHNALNETIRAKTAMQNTLVEFLPRELMLEIAQNIRNPKTINSVYELGAIHMKGHAKTNKNYYIAAMAAGTILKELYEDTSFVNNSGMQETIRRIKRAEDYLPF